MTSDKSDEQWARVVGRWDMVGIGSAPERPRARRRSDKECLALYALAHGAAAPAAAWFAGVARSTIYRWLDDAGFLEALEQLKGDQRDSMNALRAIVNDPQAPHNIRLRAVRMLQKGDIRLGMKDLGRNCMDHEVIESVLKAVG